MTDLCDALDCSAGTPIAGMSGILCSALVFIVVIFLATTVFRRQVTLALTHLFARLGLMRGTIARMPEEIHLAPSDGPTEAARPVLNTLAKGGFVSAGNWDISELPGIHVDLMVHQAEGILAVVESASTIGAQLNLHTLYPDNSQATFTNSVLPAPRRLRPGLTCVHVPRCPPAELLANALAQRPPPPFLPITPADARRLYEGLYAAEIRFRKQTPDSY